MTTDKRFSVFISHNWGKDKQGCITPQSIKDKINEILSPTAWECIFDLDNKSGRIRTFMDKCQSADMVIFFISEQFFTSLDCIYEAVSAAQSYRLQNRKKPEILIYLDILHDGIEKLHKTMVK